MSVSLEQAILEKIQALPDERQQEVLILIDDMLKKVQKTDAGETLRPIWEIIAELSVEIPLEEWAKLPTDGAEQHDHYLYGSAKRSQQ